MVYGIGLIFLLIVVSGFIAYVGDKVGRRVGKKRISIFGLRPKYTSIIITIATGIVIVSLSLTALLIVSVQSRTAFFGIQNLLADLRKKEDEYRAEERKLKDLKASSQKALREKQGELDDILGEINLKSVDLQGLRESTAEMTGKVKELDGKLEELEKKRTQLEKEIANLKSEHASILGQTSQEVLYGDILYEKEEALARMVVSKGMPEEEIEVRLSRIVNGAYKTAMERGALVDDDAAQLFRTQFKSLVDVLRKSEGDLIVEIRSNTNVLRGQPIYLTMTLVNDRLVYRKGDLIGSVVIKPGMSQTEISDLLRKMLAQASAEARGYGMIPDPETDRVGTVPAKRYIDVVKQLAATKEARTVELYVVDDTRISGRLAVDFRII